MYIVITKTSFDKNVIEKVFNISKKALPIFKKQKGFISIKMLKSHDDTHISSVIEWENKEDHEACLTCSDFNEINRNWQNLMMSGLIKFELNTYDILC